MFINFVCFYKVYFVINFFCLFYNQTFGDLWNRSSRRYLLSIQRHIPMHWQTRNSNNFSTQTKRLMIVKERKYSNWVGSFRFNCMDLILNSTNMWIKILQDCCIYGVEDLVLSMQRQERDVAQRYSESCLWWFSFRETRETKSF